MDNTATAATEQPEVKEGSLDLIINDSHGFPIHELGYKVIVAGKTIASGNSDSQGKIVLIEHIALGSIFEIHVQTDKGDYKKVAIGKVECSTNQACLTSPKTRFEFSTYAHKGSPGSAAQHKTDVMGKHNQKPSAERTITGGTETKPAIKQLRNDQGQPVAAIEYGQTNCDGVNNLSAVPPPQNASNKLQNLIKFMEHQSTLDYTQLTHCATAEIINKMIKKTFKEPAGKAGTESKQRCAIYVKVGLWYAGYGPANEAIGNGISPAKDLAPELVKTKAGFSKITVPNVKITLGKKNIDQPDIFYAAPGDVIVYKETNRPTANGHIEIRTYHGYMSDFEWAARNGYTDLKKYTVIGIYRKHSDLQAIPRIKAFLRILREHLAKGYEDPYRAWKVEGDKHVMFMDGTRHPSSERENAAAGAYQIKWDTFTNIYASPVGVNATFTPQDQDRAMIYLLQGYRQGKNYPRRTTLGYIMEGKLEQALNGTKAENGTKLIAAYPFLPGGSEGMSMSQLTQLFEQYTKEYL